MVKAFAILEADLKDKYPDELKEKSVTDVLYGALLMMCKSGKSDKEIRNYIELYEKKYPNWYKCKIINYLGKSKKLFLIFAKYKLVKALKLLSYIHTRLVG